METSSEFQRKPSLQEVKDFLKEAIDTPGVQCGINPGGESVEIRVDASVPRAQYDALVDFCSTTDFGVVVNVRYAGAIEPHDV